MGDCFTLKHITYVFDNNYFLMPLTELESFTKTYKHLPNVPSEKIIKEEGVYLGEMNKILLQKIEELTLYIIEQDKKLSQHQKEIEELKTKK